MLTIFSPGPHRYSRPSLPQVAKVFPSGAKTRSETPEAFALYTRTIWPVSVWPMIVLPRAQAKKKLPLGMKATFSIQPLCNSSVQSSDPVATFQLLTTWSSPPASNCVPSGEKASVRRRFLPPTNALTTLPVSSSRI